MEVFTIIVTYNATRNNWLQKCLDSLLKSTLKTEIVIVDNLSTDETVKVIKSKYPSVHLIENKENKGFGGANNQGLKYALESGGEYFFLLNQDAWIEKDTIEKLVTQLKKNPEYGIVSPMHLNGEGDALDLRFSNQISPYSCPNLYSDFVLNKVKEKIYETKFVCAAAWLISRECLKIVGGFSPTFFHYGEDDNYCQRLGFHNLKIGVYPNTSIFHDRKDRPKTIYEERVEVKKRIILNQLSNPNYSSSVYIKKYKSQLKNKVRKSKVLLQKEYFKHLKQELEFLELHEKDITENLKKTKSKSDFIFL